MLGVPFRQGLRVLPRNATPIAFDASRAGRPRSVASQAQTRAGQTSNEGKSAQNGGFLGL